MIYVTKRFIVFAMKNFLTKHLNKDSNSNKIFGFI